MSPRARRPAYPAQRELARAGKVPVLVYLHGGFSLDASDVYDCLPFIKAGFAVWAPAFRGENGNPGHFEFAFGELDDARAAIDAVRSFEDLDAERVVVFGHSSGGMLTSLLALAPSLPVHDTGSVGGLFNHTVFDGNEVPFVDNTRERQMRLFSPYVRQLKQKHFACVGEGDARSRPITEFTGRVAAQARVPLEIRIVPGDHRESLPLCMDAFLERALPTVQPNAPEQASSR
jgi:pimeloyl-ACP methyl ester carboxylesterase